MRGLFQRVRVGEKKCSFSGKARNQHKSNQCVFCGDYYFVFVRGLAANYLIEKKYNETTVLQKP